MKSSGRIFNSIKLCGHNDIDGQANIQLVFCPFEAYPQLPQKFKMEHFPTIVNVIYPLTIAVNPFILNFYKSS